MRTSTYDVDLTEAYLCAKLSKHVYDSQEWLETGIPSAPCLQQEACMGDPAPSCGLSFPQQKPLSDRLSIAQPRPHPDRLSIAQQRPQHGRQSTARGLHWATCWTRKTTGGAGTS